MWDRLTSGLGRRSCPSGSSLYRARKRLGPLPLRRLFEMIAGPTAAAFRWRGLLLCAFDGTELDIADSTANRSACGTHGHGDKQAGYPHLRLVALVACGTRSLLGAAFGTIRTTERDLALVLFGHLDAGMLVLLDRGFAAGQWFSDLHATGADFLARVPAHWKPGTVERLHDGSRLVLLGGLTLRLIEAEITIATAGGKRTGVYRLATTLVDPDRFPALDLIEQYLHRWEIETAYSEPFRAS